MDEGTSNAQHRTTSIEGCPVRQAGRVRRPRKLEGRGWRIEDAVESRVVGRKAWASVQVKASSPSIRMLNSRKGRASSGWTLGSWITRSARTASTPWHGSRVRRLARRFSPQTFGCWVSSGGSRVCARTCSETCRAPCPARHGRKPARLFPPSLRPTGRLRRTAPRSAG
jgi:hypothetical protein